MMTPDVDERGSGSSWLRPAWPGLLLVLFLVLGLARFLPAGVVRAVVAVPIFLTVPGALTLGGVLRMRRLVPVVFGCLTVLLSVLWLAFASLALYVLHVLITADSTYWILLAICTVLAAFAQYRLALGSSVSYAGESKERGNTGGRAVGYAVAAAVAGAVLLGGGTFVYVHRPQAAAAGYTWLAWTGPQVSKVIAVGPAGLTLPFQVKQQQPYAGDFRLTADWVWGKQEHSIAEPVTIHVDSRKTVRGSLKIPVPPGGCNYHLVLTLTTIGQAHQGSWSINADVRQRARPKNACAA